MITLVRAICTSTTCPAQWDAWDADGQYYYLRYRHSLGRIESAASLEAWHEAWDNAQWDEQTKRWTGLEPITPVATFETEDEFAVTTLEKFAELAGIALAPDLDTTGYWRHILNRLTDEFKNNPAALARVDQLLGGIDLDDE